jgi:hypothetical protein
MLILGYKHPSKIANTIVTKKKYDQPGSESKCCHLYPDWGPTKIAIC